MKVKKFLNIKGALLDQIQLENYLKKIASEHILQKKSNRNTYPIPRLDENFKQITKTYDILNVHLKLGINIHPAGEWILDNYYAIEETYKTIKKELNLKKYMQFVGIANGEYKGFARIYVLASEIVAYTDGKIDSTKLQTLLTAYQNKKTLGMEEIWNISIFFNIALIEQIRNICEKVYYVQIQKYKVESIIERLVEKKDPKQLMYRKNISNIKLSYSKEPFIEYLSYRLNQYGKKSVPYIQILEEQVEKTGTTISEIIKKEHFDIALKKLSVGNCIESIKNIQRIPFIEIFEQINGVEEILKKDPAHVYKTMTYQTKEYYRNAIKELSKKTKISELYIASKALELAKREKENKDKRKSHIGYYLIMKGIEELKKELNVKTSSLKHSSQKAKIYTGSIIILTSLLALLLDSLFYLQTRNIFCTVIFVIFSYIPLSEIVIKAVQSILSKIVKPKLIPKIDFSKGIPKEHATMVIIPTILKNKENVIDLMHKLEVYYLANQSDNLFFTLLGDCTTSNKEKEEFDEEIIETGKQEVEKLNQKYASSQEIFYFLYRKRIWNSKENAFLGWERKRGMITEFNDFLLGNNHNTFLYNSLFNKRIPTIQYMITLDSDTNLVLDSAQELIGAMAHILNQPIIDQEKNIVVEGYGILQPRIGINIDASRKTLFTKIYAGMGGTDAYSNAISDIYQDNFEEGIFTGKGIYNLKIFHQVLQNAIPENTVLSHDLLEGIYAKCGLVSDVILLDSYPSKYNSYMTRACRWMRGDWQIIQWLAPKIIDRKENKIANPISELGKFKILDNLRRSLLEITQVLCLFFLLFISPKWNLTGFYLFLFLSIWIDFVIELLQTIIFKKEGVKKQASFENKLPGLKLSIVRNGIRFSTLVYQAISSFKAIAITLYRVFKTKEHLLEWTTAEEAEQNSKDDLRGFLKEMWITLLVGLILLFLSMIQNRMGVLLIAISFLVAPYICWYISQTTKKENLFEQLNPKEKEEILQLAKDTWQYFDDFLTEENHFLPPDNYQDSRANQTVDRTSSTNIGLALMSVISAYDLNIIELEKALFFIEKMLETIVKLPKWNGHLYNWYHIKTLTPLKPEYISTVDSGNFLGYLITLRVFIMNIEDKERKEKYHMDFYLNYIEQLIRDTDFSKLYEPEISLFSIGFQTEENKLTDSYYDLLASEARQASLIAIAKKDIPSKHWNNLSRTLTSIDGKKGLVSWSGTAFEYLMPNINIRKYKGSLLDESCKFMIMSQKKYCEKLKIPWGISEAAFYLKDLNSNYQYKAFGIPWLGLKRGLADEIVVSAYGSILAITEEPKEVMKNLQQLKQYHMYGKYGFYESIDFTPERLSHHQTYEVVKTYMAHHQALILLSINNLVNQFILQKRFHQDPHIQAVDILLQEKLPEDVILTKDRKEKVEKIRYKGYHTNYTREMIPSHYYLPAVNMIANEYYQNCMNQDGTGFSKYKNYLIHRYKRTNHYPQGIFFFIKNKNTQKIWTSYYHENNSSYKIIFSSDKNEVIGQDDNIKMHIQTIVVPNDCVEIRNLKVSNLGNKEEVLEVSTVLEPILSSENQDNAHKAFNNLFLQFESLKNGILVQRNQRETNTKLYLAVGFFSDKGNIENLEYEIDKEKLYGRLNESIPKKILHSEKLTNKIGFVVNPILSYRRTIKIEKADTIEMNLVLSVSENKEEAIAKLNNYKSFENVKRAFEISKTRNEENARYLQVTGNEMLTYQTMLAYLIHSNPFKKLYFSSHQTQLFKQEDLWQYGISGDHPMVLVKIEQVNDVYVVRDLLKALLFFQNKNICVDLVILDAEKNVYERYVKEAIEKEIADKNITYLINQRIFILNVNEIQNEKILELKANFVVDAKRGNLQTILLELEEEYLQKFKPFHGTIDQYHEETEFEKYTVQDKNLLYPNEYGGFAENGKEYVIFVDETVPSAWCNVLANENFGTIVTQNLGGYSWYKNCRLNRISKWSNDTVMDTPSEYFYMLDEAEKKYWRLGKGNLVATYGFGYAKYEQNKLDLKQKLKVFVSMKENVKIHLLKLKNNTNHAKTLQCIYQVDLVLDEDEIKSEGNIDLKYDKQKNTIYAYNLYSSGIHSIGYIYSSEPIRSYTGNSNSIHLNNTAILNGENSLGNQACMAIQITIELKAFEEKEVVFVLGATDHENNIPLQYQQIEKCHEEYQSTKNYWNNLLEKVKVKTPVASFNIILNGWAMYQVIASRLLARSGFYQSGGAYGYRDQLQDSIGLKFLNTEMMKKQILKHAAHQFIEGDVEHWWHEETSRGIRTRFSDDRLWLVYVVLQYIQITKDKEILNQMIPYLDGKQLAEGQDESYDLYLPSSIQGTLYEHCMKAIQISLSFGENNLPLIGSGDWNDGFSNVGTKGKGESVWLGFFLYDILQSFLPMMEEKENTQTVNQYRAILHQLKTALNQNGWDGQWYRRAYTDSGKILGSNENTECKIDSISQSWSVISNAGDQDKQYRAMESVEKYLIHPEAKLIQLLDPPFEKSDLNPGYIQSYMPGIRENGGQYTHECCC